MRFRLGALALMLTSLAGCATVTDPPLFAQPQGCTSTVAVQPVAALGSPGRYALRADLRDGRVVAQEIRVLEQPRTDGAGAPQFDGVDPATVKRRINRVTVVSMSDHVESLRCPGSANLEAVLVVGPQRAGYVQATLTPSVEGQAPRRLVRIP